MLVIDKIIPSTVFVSLSYSWFIYATNTNKKLPIMIIPIPYY